MATCYDNDTRADLERVYAPVFEEFTGTFSADGLIAEAFAATGLSNLGGEALAEPGFHKRLNALCSALESEANLTALGRTRAHCRLLAMVISRLRTVDYVGQVSDLPEITAPLIGTGMPRTGTSFLQALLAQDPGNLVPRTGQGMVPIPPLGVLNDEQARLDLTWKMLAFQGFDSDEVNAIHPFAPDAEDEDVLFQEGAVCGLYQGFYNVPSYSPVIYEAYYEQIAWQKQLMRLIQAQYPGKRWVLKAPEYVSRLDDVLRQFPDGMVFVNHRDPARTISSIASLYVTFQAVNSDFSIPGEYLGPPMLQGQAASIKALKEWRKAHPQVKIVDIHYKQLVADPVGTAEALYGEFGLDFTSEAKASMEQFVSGRNRHGQAQSGVKHTYSLADFGLTEDMVEEAFGDYLDSYGVERERRT
ncbi:MAG: sulfotransferase [Novosphingobium sp.]|nr:sulfotransferase [Novosphingobium sp.]